MRRLVFVLLLCLPSVVLAESSSTAGTSLFDPARHMRVSEVHAGMKGYGLSVFSGTAISRFDVEVVSILKNFNPKYDVILIRCAGQNLEHSGAIAGMSGSPIYLYDDAGKARMIGAFAYGWPLVKDPLAGVQPIEYMLDVGSSLRPDVAATQQSGELSQQRRPGLFTIDPRRFAKEMVRQAGITDHSLTEINGDPLLQPLMTPLMSSGLSSRAIDQLSPMFRASHLVPLQAGGMASRGATTQPIAIEPGSVLAAPLLTGDVEMTALGTCTEVIGDRVFAFGHPFNNEGPITLPMASGYVNAIIPKLDQSFKLGSMDRICGTLIADQQVGVAGRLGKSPPTIPIDLDVVYADGSLTQHYHFESAAHPRLTPELVTAALSSALSGQRDLPQYHTVRYDLDLEFANGQSFHAADVAVNSAQETIPQTAAIFLTLAGENPFERVLLKKLSGTIRVEAEAKTADILSVNIPKRKYRAGETIKAYIRYRPFRAADQTMSFDLQLPHDLTDGEYQLSIGDQATYLQQEVSARPFRFDAETIEDTFAVLKDVASIRSDAVYIWLTRTADGVAIGRTALQQLPSSRRQILLDSGRSDVTPFTSLVEKVVPADTVINGSADFTIEIDNGDRVEASAKLKLEPHPASNPSNVLNHLPAATAAPKSE